MQLRKPDLLITVALVFSAILAIYLACAAPSVMYGDSAELQAVALDGGVGHPTGYPTFIIFGRMFGSILGGDQAHRITVMSAIFGAASVCAFIVVLFKFGLPLWVATAGALIYGLSFTFFWSSIRTEVYTVAIFIFLFSLWLTLHTLERPDSARAAAAGLCLGLVLTGHLTFAPAVIVMLLVLSLARPAGGGSRVKYIAAIAAAFIVGLLPYLYLFWADQAAYPMNYLDYTIEPAGNQYGLTARTFDDPWERVPWLILGHESQPTVFLVHLRPMLLQMLRVLSMEFIYHFGPVAVPFFVMGIYQALRKLRRRVSLLFGIIIASVIFGAGFGPGRMLQIFIIPSTIGVAVIVSFGVWFLLERLGAVDHDSHPVAGAGAGGWPKQWKVYALLVLIVFSMVAVPHAMRVRLQDSRTFPHALKMQVEGEPEIKTFIPRLSDFWEPRQYGERVLDILPENSFVVGKWKEIMVLYYLHYIEGARLDITLEPYNAAHYIRLNRWQEQYDLSTHPIVFLLHPSKLLYPSKLTLNISGVDTLVVSGGQNIYILSAPFEPLRPVLSINSNQAEPDAPLSH